MPPVMTSTRSLIAASTSVLTPMILSPTAAAARNWPSAAPCLTRVNFGMAASALPLRTVVGLDMLSSLVWCGLARRLRRDVRDGLRDVDVAAGFLLGLLELDGAPRDVVRLRDRIAAGVERDVARAALLELDGLRQ